VGTRQILIWFALCDLRYHKSDSAHTWNAPSSCPIERSPGLRDFQIHSNPFPLPILIEWVEQQNLPCLHDNISLTGDERLLHAPFLREFYLKSAPPLVYLYTWILGDIPQNN
jgi:organic radical activating enzyme